jgi:methionine-rich copper-binding protein CopC
VTAIDLAWSGAAAGLESRSVQPPAGSTTATFSVTIPTPPATGGALTLSAVARDAAGNTGSAAAVSLTVLDVVAPTVQAVVPADGATGVDPAASIVLTFSEPLDASTVSAAAVRLARSGVSVAASVSLTADGRTVTIAPAASLPVNTAITVSAADTILDRAGNHLAAFGSTFHTSSPDTTHPFLDSVNPADGTVGVAATTPIAATFSEPISPDSVTAQTFAVAIGGTPITGTFAFSSGGRIVTFTPSAALPFNATVVAQLSAGIADLAGNALATPGGDPLPAPVQVTFTTGAFAITSPSGAQIVEGDRIEIAAGASASLQVAQVVFTVGGTDIGTASASPFSVGFNVPARTASGSLTITASARNAQGVEIAHAEKTVTVVTRIQPVPAILGLARGAVGAIRLELDEPAAQDLVIALAPVDPRVVSVAAPSMTIPAGQTSATVAVTACSACPWDPVAAGSAAGNTSIVATSERGVALVVVSVSDPVHGQTIDAVASPVGVAATMPRRAADVLLASGSAARTLAITVLAQPLSGNAPVPVDISSSDPSVATATAPDLLPGQSVALLTIVAGRDGVATLIIRVGTEVWSVVVRVGTPPAGSGPIVTAAPVGLSVTAAPSAGQVVIATGRTSTITLQALSSINGGANAVPVAVTSSNAAIATATATAVQPGSSVTVLTITTFSNGIATLLLHVGNEVRSLTVVVGAQEPGRTPLALASPVGIASPALPVAGRVFAAAGGSVSVGIVLLEAPAAVQQSVTVTSGDPTIVTITASNPSIAAGSQVLQLSFATGHAGSATLTLTAGTTQRQVVVVVGGQSPDVQPVTMAPPVGLSVIPSAQVGRVLVAQGAPLAARLGVQLLATAQAASTTVVITSSNPAVVGLGAGASATTTLTAGTVAVPVDLFTSGAVGTAVLRFAFDGTVEELLVVVGNPPASDRPAITAPVIGIRIGS